MKKKSNLVIRNTENKKANIPRALREQVWIQNIGKNFEHKCLVDWCQNLINVFDFHVGHNIPESQGGATNIKNLKPICARCNLSMGNQYSIEEWSKIGETLPHKNKKQITKKEKPVTIVPVTSEPTKKPWWLFCC
jgi:5-methylcytosine-specific restriction endonuclease McrA